MDNEILKKRLSRYRTSNGHLLGVSDELLVDLLRSWEQWPGKLKDFYSSLGVKQKQLAFLMGKAKKVRREGHYPVEEFKEVKLEPSTVSAALYAGVGIELQWDDGKVIRFADVRQLAEFLKITKVVD